MQEIIEKSKLHKLERQQLIVEQNDKVSEIDSAFEALQDKLDFRTKHDPQVLFKAIYIFLFDYICIRRFFSC